MIDLCHICKLKGTHTHNEFHVWVPFLISVLPYSSERMSYYPDEMLEREWSIYNNSLEIISSPILVCVQGNPCSKF